MRHRRKGFTLLELLTVIGVMLVLMSMAVIGYRVVGNNANTRATHANLENLQSMLAEFETQQTFTSVYGFYNIPSAQPAQTPFSPTNAVISSFTTGPIGVAAPPIRGASFPIADVTVGATDRFGPVVNATMDAMAILVRVPTNKQVIAQVPSKSLLKDVNGQAYTVPPTPPPPGVTPSNAVPRYCMVDGWNNPIILVPAGGLVLNVPDPASTTSPQGTKQMLVRSTGTTPFTGTAPPVSVNDRPFWASAGPDGDFSTGEDNIYSFQK